MIAVIGESLIDMIPNASGGYEPVVGGSPLNTAVAAALRGVPTCFIGEVSMDAFGELIYRRLAGAGVQMDWVRRVDALSTIGFASFDAASQTTRYQFYTNGTAGCDTSVPTEAELAGVCYLHAASFSLAVGQGSEKILGLLEASRGKRIVSVDPNIRPFLLGDRADALAQVNLALDCADIIKLSDEDLDWLGYAGKAEAFAAERLARGASWVVLTMGGQGCRAWYVGGELQVPTEKVEVVDTIGAGDTFSGNLLAAALRHGIDSPETLRVADRTILEACLCEASYAAAINCTRKGCQPPTADAFPKGK